MTNPTLQTSQASKIEAQPIAAQANATSANFSTAQSNAAGESDASQTRPKQPHAAKPQTASPAVKLSRGFSTFMNWFNGICAPLCGLWMMASALFALPLSWNDWMPLSIYDPFPFHDVFFTSHFWPGLALLLVNGAPNIVAIVQRHRAGYASWARWCIAAGALLIVWTTTELFVIPNGLSVFYFALGILQAATAVYLERQNRISPDKGTGHLSA